MDTRTDRRRELAARLTAVTAALAALLVLAPAVEAFEIAPFVTPGSTDAGANTSLQLDVEVDDEPDADLRNLTIHLPPGLVADRLAAPTCTVAQLAADGCPAATRVGTTAAVVNAFGVPVPVTIGGSIYNLAPQPGEPARFGFVLRPPAPLPSSPIIRQAPVRLRQGDPRTGVDTVGLDIVLTDLPRFVGFVPIDITDLSLTLFGQAGSPPRGFIRLPTSCRVHTVAFGATAYTGQGFLATDTFSTLQPSCALLPFTPQLSARITRTGPVSEPVGVSTTIAQTPGQAGLGKGRIVLPAGLGTNNAALGNQCPYSTFQAGACPAASIVGTAELRSPLWSQALSGSVALLQPEEPGLPDLGIDLRGPVALKLIGRLGVTSASRTIVSLHGLPDIPISASTLTFAGGPGGLVTADRDVCEPPPLVFDGHFDSHAGGNGSNVTATATVDCAVGPSDGDGDGGGGGGGDGGGGGGGGPSEPRATIKLGRLGSDEPTMKLKLKAGAEKLRQAKLKLPRELAFAGGRAFDRGTKVKAGGGKASVEQSRRALKLKTKKAAKSLVAKFADGALEPGQGLREGKRLKFKLKLRDAAGETTKLTVRAK